MMYLVDAVAWLLIAMIWKREGWFNISLWLIFTALFIVNAIFAAPFALKLAGGA